MIDWIEHHWKPPGRSSWFLPSVISERPPNPNNYLHFCWWLDQPDGTSFHNSMYIWESALSFAHICAVVFGWPKLALVHTMNAYVWMSMDVYYVLLCCLDYCFHSYVWWFLKRSDLHLHFEVPFQKLHPSQLPGVKSLVRPRDVRVAVPQLWWIDSTVAQVANRLTRSASIASPKLIADSRIGATRLIITWVIGMWYRSERYHTATHPHPHPPRHPHRHPSTDTRAHTHTCTV